MWKWLLPSPTSTTKLSIPTPRFVRRSWVFTGTVESLIISIVPLFTLTNSFSRGTDWEISSLWDYGATSFTLVVLVTNLKLMLNQYQFPWFCLVCIIVSVGSWFATGIMMTSVMEVDFRGYKVYESLLNNYSYWLTLPLVLVLCGSRDFFYKGFQRAFKPQLHHVLGEISRWDLGEEKEGARNGRSAVQATT